MNDITLRQALEDYFSDEFPAVKLWQHRDYLVRFGISPNKYVRLLNLVHVYKIAQCFNEDFINLVEAFAASARLN